MNFIKLTPRPSGIKVTPIYINASHIQAMAQLEDCTAIFVTGNSHAEYYVVESPEAIMALIELKERGKNA